MSYPILPASDIAGPSKVPIPRLQKPRSEAPRKASVNRLNRVSRACLSCRSRKIKCNGLQPRCSNCSENATSCVYASGRKDRLKTATLHNQHMITLLRDLRQQVSGGGQDRIDDLLANVVEDVADAAAAVGESTDRYHEPVADEDRGEANVSAEVGSSGDMDLLDEDLMRNEETRATGFIGKASEIQWLRKLHAHGSAKTSEGGPWGPPGDGNEAIDGRLAALRKRQHNHPSPLLETNRASSYLDDEIFETDLMVDPFELPPFDVAERLMQAYMESVHNSFPFLQKKAFVNYFYQYYASLQHGNPLEMSRKWQTTLNLVFAIGAVYSHLTMTEWRADERDHLIYHSRAWSLSLKDPWWFAHPNLPHMQILGLLSFYYLSIGHVNRSWVLIGMSMRTGFALGMHLRSEDRNTGAAWKEAMSRIWWAHYSFERLISALIGRPTLGTGNICSVPLLLPLSSMEIEGPTIESRFGDRGKQPALLQSIPASPRGVGSPGRQNHGHYTTGSVPANSGSYLKAIVHLGEITQGALTLYDANTVSRSWESVQKTIAHENERLDAWASSLPEGLSFFHRTNIVLHQYRREQNTLDFLYNSTKILITRPCLCRLDRRISNQTASSNDFNQRAALLCVGAAKSVANLLPDAISDNLVLLYQLGPWWQMVHVVMQALVVLLLEVVYEEMHFPEDRQEVVPSLKKLLWWLRVMRVNNRMAVRAYAISLSLLKKLVTTIKIDITDLISEDERMNTSQNLDPRRSRSSSSRTPYPDVLNPVHTSHTTEQLHHQQQHRNYQNQQQQHEQQPSDANQYFQDPRNYSQPGPSHLNSSTSSFQLPSIHNENNSQPDPYALNDLFQSTVNFDNVIFPGWFVTSFDEQNPLPGFDFDGENVGAREEGERHGR